MVYFFHSSYFWFSKKFGGTVCSLMFIRCDGEMNPHVHLYIFFFVFRTFFGLSDFLLSFNHSIHARKRDYKFALGKRIFISFGQIWFVNGAIGKYFRLKCAFQFYFIFWFSFEGMKTKRANAILSKIIFN